MTNVCNGTHVPTIEIKKNDNMAISEVIDAGLNNYSVASL